MKTTKQKQGAANKRKGKRKEKKAQALLQDLRYDTILSTKSAGPFDLVAWNQHEIRFIQVKSNKQGVTKHTRAAILSSPVPESQLDLTISREIWVWENYRQNPEIEML